jgi:hypothetical protein
MSSAVASAVANRHAELAATGANPLSKRYDPRCGPAEAAYTSVNDIIACYHYLNNLGTTICATRGSAEMCRAGQAHIVGEGRIGSTSSYW